MKRLFLLIALIGALIYSSNTVPVIAEENSQDEITEGREYWFGVPYCKRDASEPVRWGTYPIELWVSSKVNTRVMIESADGTMPQTFYPLSANKVKVIQITDFLENKESEVRRLKGIHMVGDDPISVGVFYAYKWTGEALRVTPVEWLGRKYYTLNMYQDRVRMYSGYTDYKPAQILICATEDKTEVKYYPACETEAGVKKNEMGKVTLNKGETFLILAKIFENLNQDFKTDLSGTYIEASKPISVISGHTKAAFPRFSTTMLGTRSDFMRNMLVDMMWPVELLGKEYVSAPIKYLNRTYTSNNMLEDMKGDIIRFVPTEDNQLIYQMREDGSGLKQISPVLKKGQWYDITNQETPGYYVSNYKVLVGQYGKAWWLTAVSSAPEKKDDDQIQNPPRNGQGMMFCLTPIEQWCSYATFRVPFGMDNFVYFTFKTKELNELWFDGSKFTTKFGSTIREIKGTEYSYVTEVVGPGDHFVKADNGAKFAGYAYGNWDASKDGFAYGYPIGINYATKCEDSLYIVGDPVCGDVEANAFVLPPDSSCAVIFSVRGTELNNYELIVDEFDPTKAKTVTFHLKVIDIKKYAKATVVVMSRSGRTATKTWEYEPQQVEVEPTFVNFGLLSLNEKQCRDIKITNPSSARTYALVKDVKLLKNEPEFTLVKDKLPVTLQPGEFVTIQACGTGLKPESTVWDSVIVALECYEDPKVRLELKTGEPMVTIGDALWENIPVGNEESRTVEIHNISTVPVELYTIDWQDKTHFTEVENLIFPLVLEPDARHNFKVYYKPNAAGIRDSTRAYFTGNTEKVKLYSDWIGNGIEAGPAIVGYDWKKRRVIDDYSKNVLMVTEYEGTVMVKNTSILSEGGTKLDVERVYIENDFGGVFRIETKTLPKQLNPEQEISLKAWFAPQPDAIDNIEEYTTNVVFEAKFNNKLIPVKAELHGIELQPHIDITDYDFGTIKIDDSKDGSVDINSILKSDISKMELTVIKDIRIEGNDKASFVIDPQFFVSNLYPIKIQPGDKLNVPITFTAKRAGVHTAQLVCNHDAPENPAGLLIGKGFNEGLLTTDHIFPKQFITLTAPAYRVSLQNTGSETIKIMSQPQLSGTDKGYFEITGYYLESTNQEVTNFPVDLASGDKLFVACTFTPLQPQKYVAQVDYVTSIGNAASLLEGEGNVIRTRTIIPKNYKAKPSDPITIEVKMEQPAGETQQLSTANIYAFETIIEFSSKKNKTSYDVFPLVNGVGDIITTGTLTEGWEVASAVLNEVVEGDYTKTRMIVIIQNKDPKSSPLSGLGTLFSFRIKAYLSDLNEVPLPVTFVPKGTPWVIPENEPGKIIIEPVCVNSLRLVQLTDKAFTLYQSTPNPTSGLTSVQYSIGMKSHTNISIYNSFGQKIYTLIDQELDENAYELTFDVNTLGLNSGVYQIRLTAGSYSDTKSFVVTK